MSADEFRSEQHSSVKISQTAKGDPVVEVKAYSHDLDNLDACRERAVETFKQTLADIGWRKPAVVA